MPGFSLPSWTQEIANFVSPIDAILDPRNSQIHVTLGPWAQGPGPWAWAQGLGPRPWAWAQGHGPGPRAWAQGLGPGPGPRAMGPGPGPRAGPRAMSPWSLALAKNQDQDTPCQWRTTLLMILTGFGFGYSQFRITSHSQAIRRGDYLPSSLLSHEVFSDNSEFWRKGRGVGEGGRPFSTE